jgi:hypothetical protein
MYFYGYKLLPSASITRFEPSDIRHMTLGNGDYNAIQVPPSIAILQANENRTQEVPASGAVILTVARQTGFRANRLRIESVMLVIEPVPFLQLRHQVSVIPRNVVMPTRFLAILNSETTQRLSEKCG